ncbi:MAG: polyether ionophore transport system permease protein, partial [Solirubrobacteraceae bacterium]|nr:polyether ionophore transport system permease protein [Solirubrobacteraceae bacterium]
GLLAARDRSAPRLALLSSPAALALRGERAGLLAWLAGIGIFAFVIGSLATTVSDAGISADLEREIQKVGGSAITTPTGYIGLTFLFFVLGLSLFACSQVAAARREELAQRLETLFALPVARRDWLAGRVALAAAATAVLALATGALAWAGAVSQGADVSFLRMLEAGANCLPAALLFGALGALALATLPRPSAGIAYGLVAVAFVWELLGAMLGAPAWTLALSPFHHVGLVPSEPFRAVAALVMLALAGAAALAAAWAFRRRDLSSA